jgi:folate-binding protein YgfZ
MLCSALEDMTAYTLEGEDAVTFLQGQLTQDMHALSEHTPKLAAFCDHKGQVHCVFSAYASASKGVVLLARKDGLEAIMRRLGLFILRAKVQIKPMNSTVYGCFDPDTNAVWVTLTPPTEIQPMTREHWIEAALEASYPLLAPANPAQYLAQLLNLDLIGGVEFKKGCYVGQEAIARTHYRGKVTRRMVAFEMPLQSSVVLHESLELTYGEDGEASFTPIFVHVGAKAQWVQGIISLVALEKSQGNLRIQGQSIRLLAHPDFAEA